MGEGIKYQKEDESNMETRGEHKQTKVKKKIGDITKLNPNQLTGVNRQSKDINDKQKACRPG